MLQTESMPFVNAGLKFPSCGARYSPGERAPRTDDRTFLTSLHSTQPGAADLVRSLPDVGHDGLRGVGGRQAAPQHSTSASRYRAIFSSRPSSRLATREEAGARPGSRAGSAARRPPRVSIATGLAGTSGDSRPRSSACVPLTARWLGLRQSGGWGGRRIWFVDHR